MKRPHLHSLDRVSVQREDGRWLRCVADSPANLAEIRAGRQWVRHWSMRATFPHPIAHAIAVKLAMPVRLVKEPAGRFASISAEDLEDLEEP